MNQTFVSANENPFRTSALEAVSWLPEPLSLKEIYSRWQGSDFCGQIVGDHGAGKTTLALKLMELAKKEGHECLYLFCNSDSKRSIFKEWDAQIQHASAKTIIIFDGIERASIWKRRNYLKRNPQKLVLSHQQIKDLPIVIELKPDKEIFIELCALLAGTKSAQLLQKAGGAEALLRRHKNNFRDALFEMYRVASNFKRQV